MSENNGNGHLEHIYERSQKLTEALYRVTDLFSDSEPLKWLLRRDGLEIFESILKIKTASPNERVRGLDIISENIRQSIRTLELASSGSFISEANFQVLKREYLNLADYLSERKYDILPEPSAVGLIGHEPIGQLSNGFNGQHVSNQVHDKNEENESGQNSVLTTVKSTALANNVGGGERRGEIISFIKEKDWVSIGELADVFRGRISGKTLQRDLVGMATEGLLIKEGEKRWRRYKLAPAP
ncbi:MAG: hypothetical protein A2931_01990 [Candidatus Niyogibacteria bacterium RIFCSPLOWO2_01_FULL_45_48]|uniref:HTH deoR-type domain-containing protein n=2 Tax=Candidatus Niyogiibacteriota TaxID=1817912 RepID=A0A1G2F0I0_9BACT|nr:MAG: hypothetical protein A2835_02595 [Candidatus Niyogibacteria bacterium RIFCSPHIGHO2_01_FULL_45_28]OGZ30666.1 MAG: hypothetical protein A2931_01990 [Candidatus Niyogibacteria bacterium RIFCSPLOWO2_01_FULL_45_48]OGZ31252.1 MAG: hypothetical protein A3J00_01770 [Candidatus Niyogibacteria bacterium RIFCSPLOWO2_02_FULL_45_13]